MRSLLSISTILLILCLHSSAQVRNTENTLKLAEGMTGEKATLADMAWLTGIWSGDGLGGISEEMWSPPAGGVMVGTYRLMKGGKPVFYEMCWILETEGTLILRLKHFNSDLTSWEEKDKTVDFKFVKKDGKRAYFSGLTYERAGGGELKIYLALKHKDGTLKEELFTMRAQR